MFRRRLVSSPVPGSGMPRAVGVVGVVCAGALVVSGCGPLLTVSGGTTQRQDTSAGVPVVAVEGEDSVTGRVNIDVPVRVVAKGGVLADVAVTGPDGVALPGSLTDSGGAWVSVSGKSLPFDTAYKVSAVAVGPEGERAQVAETFATVAPSNTPVPSVSYIADGKTFGVGMPIVVSFGAEVGDAEKKVVESKLVLKTSKPVMGAWSWNDDSTQVTFRPKEFWPANTHVVLDGRVRGTQLNEDTAAGDNITLDYMVGDSFVMEVDQPSLTMTVKRNGQVEKTIPVTIGKPGYETYEGIKVISAKEGTITMKSPAGDPEYYVADNVEYSMRLTDHGEYIHAAPWAASAFGNYRYSHGCISMSTANAAALFAEAHPGDVVWVNGQTGQPWRKDNGISVWNETWDEWLAGSATGARTVTVQG